MNRIRWRRYLGRTVTLTLAEQRVEGVLTYASRDLLVLRAAVIPASGPGDRSIPLDGEVVVERSNLVFGQVV